MVPERPRSNQELLDEVRRQARRRRARRNRRVLWITVAALVTALAVVIPLEVVRSGGGRLRVGGALGAATTTAPTTPAQTVGPGTTRATVPTTAPASTGVPSSTPVPPATSARLPLVVCPTTFGIPSPAPTSLPPTMPVQVSPAKASELAVYSDDQGTMKLVAPVGWQCRAQYGADGSGGVAVYPRGESVPSD